MPFNREKFKDLMHYVIWRTRDRDEWGMTKIFKVLWFFEAKRFMLANERFSGARYIRDEHGPRPKGAYAIIAEMEAEGRIKRYEEPYYNHALKRLQPLRHPPAGLLNEDQAKELDYWVRYIDSVSAGAISEESHDYGWRIVDQGAELPLHAFMAERVRDPDDEELAWAKRRAVELKLP